MQSKNNILKELSEDQDIRSNIFIEEFKNNSMEEEFSKFNTEFLDKASFIVCVFVMIYLGITIGYIPSTFPNHFYFIYIAIFALIVDVTLVYLYFKSSFAYDIKFKIKLAKFVLNMMYFFWYCFMYVLYIAEDKRYFMLNNFVMQAFLLLFSYLFFIRSSSKFLCLSVFTMYFSIYILTTFTTYKVKVSFSNGVSLGITKECNTLINYQNYIDDAGGYFNSTYITYKQESYQKKIANLTADYYANKDYYDSIGYNLGTIYSSNPFDFKTYAKVYDEIVNNVDYFYSCYNYYNKDFLFFIFDNFPVVNFELYAERDILQYVTEIIACIFGASLFYLSNFFNQYRRVVFIKGKETEKLMNYFNNMINNMQCQLISFAEDKVIFSNEKFNKQVNDNINLKIENRGNEPNYFKTAESNILTMKKKENIMICENNKEEKELKEIHSQYQYKYNAVNNNNNNNAYSKKNDNNLEVFKLYTENNEINEEINNTLIEEEYNLKILDYLKEFTIESLTTNITELLLKNKNNSEILNIDASDNNIELINRSNNLNDNELSCFVQSNHFSNLLQVYEKILEIEKKSLRNSSNKNLLTNNTNYDKDEEAILKKKSVFQLIGTFKYYKRNYKVFIRKFYHKKDKFIIDIMIDDVTEIKSAERMSFETKLKQKLFSKMAHEFKTPLIVIKSLISDLNDPDIEAENKKKLLAYIYYLSDYITFLINDIIYYSNNKEITTVKEEVDLFELMDFCEGVTESLLSVMPGNKSRVIVSVDMNEDKISKYNIKTDTIKLKQVMLNLISNAVKFTKFGEIKLSAFIHEDSLENPYLILAVQDSGIGIKPKDLEKINNLDDQVLNINTDYAYNSMGTGLGLGIVKRICRALDYKFNIETMYGKGTISKITIDSISKKNNSNRTVGSNNIKEHNKKENEHNERSSSGEFDSSNNNNIFTDESNANLKEEINEQNKNKTICFTYDKINKNHVSFKNLVCEEAVEKSKINNYNSIDKFNPNKHPHASHHYRNSISSYQNVSKNSDFEKTHYFDPNLNSNSCDFDIKNDINYFDSDEGKINCIKNKIYNTQKSNNLNANFLNEKRTNKHILDNLNFSKSNKYAYYKNIIINNTVNQYLDKSGKEASTNNENVNVKQTNHIKKQSSTFNNSSDNTVYLLKGNLSPLTQIANRSPKKVNNMLDIIKKTNDALGSGTNKMSKIIIKNKSNYNKDVELFRNFEIQETIEDKDNDVSIRKCTQYNNKSKNNEVNANENDSNSTLKYIGDNSNNLIFKSHKYQRVKKPIKKLARRSILLENSNSFVVEGNNKFLKLNNSSTNNKFQTYTNKYSNLVISTIKKLLSSKNLNNLKKSKKKLKQEKNSRNSKNSLNQSAKNSINIQSDDLNRVHKPPTVTQTSKAVNYSKLYKKLKEAVKSNTNSFKNNTTPFKVVSTERDNINQENENSKGPLNSAIVNPNITSSKYISNIDLNNFDTLQDLKTFLVANNVIDDNHVINIFKDNVNYVENNNNEEFSINNNKTINTINTNDNVLQTINTTINTKDAKDKILIVDDTEAIRKSLKKLLMKNSITKDNYDIIEAKDGVEILNIVMTDQIEGSKIKMIITDENMEYMSGSTAVALIRQMENENKIHHIIIISLTAFSDEETQKNILSKGVNAIIPKPISLNDLNKLIDTYL